MLEEILEVVASRDKNALLNLLKELGGSDAELIIDELIINLKDKFINQNSKFSILIFERFYLCWLLLQGSLLSFADQEVQAYLRLIFD